MTDLALLIECDSTAAPSAGVALGEGWARVTLRGGPQLADLAAGLRRARAMLGAGAPEALDCPLRVAVAGPDAPAGAELAALVSRALCAWAAAPVPAPPAPAPPAPAPPAPSAALAPRAGGYGGRDRAGPQAGAAAQAGLTAQASLAGAMAQTISAYVAKYGAAPDFRLGRSGDRDKVYKYIRSTTGRQQASDELVEAVRCLLID